jgi:GT2 family glycosyltransferase
VNHYVITPTWNSGQDFVRCAASLAANTYVPARWVVVENGSQDDERLLVERTGLDMPRRQVEIVHYQRNRENLGIPVAQNVALDWIGRNEPGLYDVVLLDADTEVLSGWLGKILEFAGTHPDVGIVGGAKSPQGTPCPVYHTPNGRWYVHDFQYRHSSGFMEGESIDFSCAYLRPELLERGLRFDESYRVYDGHDQDLSFRGRSWGFRVWQIDAGVLHYASSAMKRAGYQWSGGGRREWDSLRARNEKRFADRWAAFLAPRRKTIEDEIAHMQRMDAKLVAEAGELKHVPVR